MDKKEKKINKGERGFAILIATFFALIIMLSIALSMGFVIFFRQKNSENMVKSSKAYFAAEAGIEDALLRLKKTPQISSINYTFSVDEGIADVTIPETIGISKAITSKGDSKGMIRNLRVIMSIDNTASASFYYGIEVGAGGLKMSNGSRVKGNVFSGGNIYGGSGIIDNDAIVSGNGNSISDVRVKGNAMAYSCLSSATIDGDLTYVTGGTHDCSVGGTVKEQSSEISEQPLPIPQSQIDDWKSEAAAGGIITRDVLLDSNQSLGSVKIIGNLIIGTNVVVVLKGSVYVTGNISFENNAQMRLDSSYGSAGGVIISDGSVTIRNGNIFSGSGQAGSYIMVISTSTSDTAIDIQNNAEGVVLYTNNGGITVHNNTSVTEATGYKVILMNNAEVEYGSGMVNIYFSSGPGAGWKVLSWQEE